MEIWLRHPDHGVKCAHLVSEATQDEKNGWERFDFRAEIAASKVQETEIAVNAAPAVMAVEMSREAPIYTPKKRGRKPKNKG